jgi:hypothetical protein
MPHDANGKLLKVGDKVSIPGTITNITTSEEYCNCSVELDHAMPPYVDKTTLQSINTKQVVLTGSQGEAASGAD